MPTLSKRKGPKKLNANALLSKSHLSESQRNVAMHFFGLEESRQRRALELACLLHEADSDRDRKEIAGALLEVLFDKETIKVVTPDAGVTREGKRKLAAHRQHVGRNVKRRREKLHMTQEKLEEESGLPQSHISRIEGGKHAATFVTIERLAKALKCRPSDLDPGFDDDPND